MIMSRKILIVEDNDKNRRLIADILNYYGYVVMEATNGQEGIDLTREFKPDLIFMDMQMPVMDGFTAIKILKNDPTTKHIKIIAITSFAMVGDKERILSAGADEYIPKPVNTMELPARVEKLLGKQ
jgi:two-component system cell cycle response regulator DivK